MNASLGFRGEMRDNVHKSEELIIETFNTLDKHISLKIHDLTKNIFLMSFFIFSLFGLSMFLISKRNMHKLQVLTDSLNDVNNSLEKRIKTEIQHSKIKDKLALEEAYKAQNTLNKSLKIFSNNVIASETDTKGIITFVSKALCKISGYKSDELIGQPHNILRHPETKKLFLKRCGKI